MPFEAELIVHTLPSSRQTCCLPQPLDNNYGSKQSLEETCSVLFDGRDVVPHVSGVEGKTHTLLIHLPELPQKDRRPSDDYTNRSNLSCKEHERGSKTNYTENVIRNVRNFVHVGDVHVGKFDRRHAG